MSKQPEALRLADALDANATNGDMGRKPDPKCHKRQAAAELRCLYEVNVELLEALKPFAALLSDNHKNNNNDHPVFGINGAIISVGDLRLAVTAIAKAEGEQA